MPGPNGKAKKTNTAMLVVLASAIVLFVAVATFSLAYAFNGDTETYNGKAIEAGQEDTDASIEPEGEVKGIFDNQTIYENITVQGTDIGGKTKEEAAAALTAAFGSAFAGEKISFTNQSNVYDVQFNEIYVTYDILSAVEAAYEYGREADAKTAEQHRDGLKNKPYDIPLEITYDETQLKAKITEIGTIVDTPAVEPTISRKDGAFAITPPVDGLAMNAAQAAQQAAELILKGKGGTVALSLETVAPKHTAADFEKATTLIGAFTTHYSGGDNNRIQNMRNAAEKINNIVVWPGEVFSTNEAFGAMTYDNGYRNAPTIQGGKLVDGMGGGVCQISSTLYDALLYAELAIVERQNHSLKVGYSDWGYDATLAGTYIDLKFKNDTEYPVTIESYLTSNTVVVNLYGYEIHKPGRKIVLENAYVGSNPPPAELITEDPTLPLNERVEVTAPKTGYVYNLYKLVYQDGVFVEKVQVNTSTYRPVRGEYRVGTGPAATEAPDPNATPVPSEATEPSTAPAETQTAPGTESAPSTEAANATAPAEQATQNPAPETTAPTDTASTPEAVAETPPVETQQALPAEEPVIDGPVMPE